MLTYMILNLFIPIDVRLHLTLLFQQSPPLSVSFFHMIASPMKAIFNPRVSNGFLLEPNPGCPI